MFQLEKDFLEMLRFYKDGDKTDKEFLQWYKDKIVEYHGKLPMIEPPISSEDKLK